MNWNRARRIIFSLLTVFISFFLANLFPQYFIIDKTSISIVSILSKLNHFQGIAEWLLLFIAVLTVLYARSTFLLQRRPYIDVEPKCQKYDDRWVFAVALQNKGSYPARARITFCELKVGDSIYPSHFKTDFYVFPGESKVSPQIGFITQAGINEIKTNQYVSNTVEIKLTVESTEIREMELKYLTHIHVRVDVKGVDPVYNLIKHEVV